MKASLTFSVILIIQLVGCQAVPPPASLPTVGTIALPTAFQPSETPLYSSATSIPSASPPPSATPTQISQRFRIDADPTFVARGALPGTIVFTGPGPFRHFLYDPSTGAMADLPGQSVRFPANALLAISPDRSTFTYSELTSARTTRVHFGSSDPSKASAFLLPRPGSYEVVGWINEDLIALAAQTPPDGGVLALDVHSLSLSEIPPPFPISTEDGPLAWDMRSMYAIYNRSLSRVVTARFIDNRVDVDPPVPMRFPYELWDVSGARMLWGASGGGWSTPPAWSPDGSHFAVAYDAYRDHFGPREDCLGLHVISTEGEDRLLGDCSWIGYSWSPDGTLVASWEGTHTDRSLREARLKVYDLARGSYNDYSIRFAEQTLVSISMPPVWSPDGRFIAFSELGESSEPVRAWILNLETTTVGVLMNGVRVEGWLR